MLFQSLLGFPMRCDIPLNDRFEGCEGVSIPIGFSNALRLNETASNGTDTNEFQSLLGFPMRCDDAETGKMPTQTEPFQSLLGFPMRCDEDAYV